ncbi:metal-dependent hydrolase [Aliifodinibius salipaludis]|uniref:Metal-dependent hydrolase n=1 Tax=Fodinibius salipaludis TaxID=2032627 RepID=A0A2A2G777_9BACT|nr:putative metal-dependent hydrolase [Aliifodinibius salipaludis]PAU92709.1 metal-dependent hydrolase [Aliifodinibius salipaludis]
MEELKYPIGREQINSSPSAKEIVQWIDDIRSLPEKLSAAVAHFSDKQLDTPYRKDGWTVRQVVHHIADSHINGYTRIKLTLTESKPTIKPYQQESWAALLDSSLPIESSLKLIDGLHKRWSYLLTSLNKKQLNRELNHPESGTIVVKHLIGHYAWHGNHHLAHITSLKKRKNWT